MTDEDRATLEGLIEMRLGNSALQMTRHRLTTDKNESINRSFSASLPNNVKFSRNAHGRVSSVIDRINYGAGNSMLRKLENVYCPITRGEQVARAVKQIQHEVEYQRQYKRRSSVRLHIRHTKLKRMQNYFDSNRNRVPEDRYLKCQLEPKPSTRKGKKRPAAVVKPVVTRSRRRKTTLPTANREDHPYSLQSRKSADHSYASRK